MTIGSAGRSRTKTVLFGSLSMLGARIFAVVVSLISVAFLTRQFGREEFGLWSILGTFVGYAGSFDFGLGQGLRNQLAKLAARAQRDTREEARLFYTVLIFLLLLSVASALVLGSLSLFVHWAGLLGVTNPALAGPAQAATTAVIVLLLLNLPLGLNLVGFLAYQDAVRRGLFDALQSLALLLGVLVFSRLLSISQFITAYYVLFDLASLVALIAFLWQRHWSFPRLNWSGMWSVVRELSGPSVSFWLLSVSSIALFTTDALLVAHVTNIARAGDFNIIQKLVTLFIGVHLTVFAPLWSAYTHAAEQGDWPWIRRIMRRSVVVTLALFVAGGALMMILEKPLLTIWTGRNIADPPLLFALLLWATLYALVNCASVLLNGLGVIRVQMVTAVVCALVHIPISYALGVSAGPVGVVWGTVLSIVPMCVINFWQVSRLLRQPRAPA